MTQTPPNPSTRRILRATALALAIAVLVLVVAVLPAEYGIDPLGTGRALGLTALAGTEEAAAGPTGATDADRRGVDLPQAGTLSQDTYTVELRPYEGVEYKYRLEKGASLVYSWKASAAVDYDFHGEPDGAPQRYSESYGKGTNAAAAGSFLAPTPGIHGWFWENTGAGRVTVTLTASGFYSASTEYRDGERKTRMFGGPDQPPR